ncbi:MAG: GGDEF domain-containing protein, partial [Terriglobia bacterium]
ASRCLGTIGRPGKPPSAAVEFCAPGVPNSPGPAIVKLLGLVAQVDLDPEKGAALDTQLTPELKKVGIQSALAMALRDKESQEPEGLIILAQADQRRPWRPNDVYLLKAVTDQAVTAMSHIKLRSLMKRLSVADDASGLLARSSYLDCLVGEVGRAKTQGTPLVVALLELDQAAELRRQVGDTEIQNLMQQAGEAVFSGARQNDLAFRYTATSLALVLGDTTADKVQSVIEKLRAKLATFKLGDRAVTFSAALSEAAVRPDYDAEDIVTDVINRAEFSLEKAREKGNVTLAQ